MKYITRIGLSFGLLIAFFHHAHANCSKAVLLLTEGEVARYAPSTPEMISLMRQMFQWKADGRITMIPKPILHPSPKGDTYATALMSSIQPPHADPYVGMKFSMGIPENPARGLPYIQSEIILRDFATGQTLAIMDGNWITGMRTGAVSAVAAEYLSSPQAEEVAFVSAGRQARTHLQALMAIRKLKRAKVFDPHPESIKSFINWATEAYPLLNVTAETDLQKLVETADILVTAAPIQKAPARLIQREWLKPNAFIVSLDFDSSLSESFVDLGQYVITDDFRQFAAKKEEGFFSGYQRRLGASVYDPIDAELSDVVAGLTPKINELDSAHTQRVFLNLGISPSDLILANEIYLNYLKSQSHEVQ